MKLYFSCLGLISFIVLGALAKESVKVSRDIVTKASPDVIMAPEDKVNVTLNCTGSRPDLSYYIRNRITWTYIKEDGTSKDLTMGFYLSDNIDTNKMKLEIGADIPPELGDSGYLFSLTITGVTRADDGIYKCSLLGEGDTVIDSKELKVTVVNPVQTVSIELHDAQNNLISKSSSPARPDGATVKITPGKYIVKCVATGSNPEPVMNLFLNQQSLDVAINTKRVEGAQLREYEGSFEVKSLTINAQNSPQLLNCSANIPNGDKNAEAGLSLMVIPYGSLAKESLKVSRDIVTKASPDVIMVPKDKVNITLNCTGSRSDLSFYVRNKVKWTFIASSGAEIVLTEGFYAAKTASDLFSGPDAHYKLTYNRDCEGYKFDLTLTGVTRADDGIYQCTLHGVGDTIIDSKELKVTVVNPVQTVTIELHDAQNNLISKSSSPARQDGATVKITPAKYNVKCVATGSNPKPVMNLFFNQQSLFVAINTKRVEGAQFREYEGSLEVKNLTINAQNSPQFLTCTANIPNGDKDAEASLSLMVTPYDTSIAQTFYIEGHFGQTNVTVDEHDADIQFKCIVNSHPKFDIKIMFEGDVLKEQVNDSSLSFSRHDVSCFDAGVYTCEGRNVYGQKSTKNITLFVQCNQKTDRECSRQTSDKTTALIVGLTLGVVCCIAIMYAAYVTILRNRLLRVGTKPLDSSGRQVPCANPTFASDVPERGDASIQQYSDLCRYANTDSNTYDLINKI